MAQASDHSILYLHQAINANDKDEFECLIDSLVEKQEQDKVNKLVDGKNALHLAIVQSNRYMVDQLLTKCFPDIALRDVDGYLPIHLCIRKDEVRIMHRLLEYCLQQSGVKGCIDMLRSTSTNRTYDGYNLLHLASNWEAVGVMDYLLGRNGQSKNYLLQRARAAKSKKSSKPSIVDCSLDGDEEALKNEVQEAPKTSACPFLSKKTDQSTSQKNSSDSPELLQGGGGCVFQPLPRLASLQGDSGINMLEVVPISGVIPTDGRTALHCASFRGQLTLVHFLLDDDRVDIDPIDNFGLTPLALAASQAREEVCKMLLECGADPNIADRDENTALHHAFQVQCQKIFNGCFPLELPHFEIAYMLVLAGADIDAENKDGLSPLQIPSEAVEDIFEVVAENLKAFRKVPTFGQLTSLAPEQIREAFLDDDEEESGRLINGIEEFNQQNEELQKKMERSGGCPVFSPSVSSENNPRQWRAAKAAQKEESQKAQSSEKENIPTPITINDNQGLLQPRKDYTIPFGHPADGDKSKCPFFQITQKTTTPPVAAAEAPVSSAACPFLKGGSSVASSSSSSSGKAEELGQDGSKSSSDAGLVNSTPASSGSNSELNKAGASACPYHRFMAWIKSPGTWVYVAVLVTAVTIARIV